MARRRWLDPLARRLLIASGQIVPPPSPTSPPDPPGPAGERQRQDAIERDLLALRLSQNPALRLRDAEEVRHAAALGWSLDVNRATAADWQRLPGCGPDQADLLVRLQRGGVQLSGLDDLSAVLGCDRALVEAWDPLLCFRWYGHPTPAEAPAALPVNQATALELAALPELTPERQRRLLRERGRGPFRDLADLRDRLGLPASVVEQWIGRLSFEPGPAGPTLPPAQRGGRGRA